MKVALVCGGRDYANRKLVFSILDVVQPETILQGGARGADSFAALWAASRNVPCLTMPADWEQHGRRAGYIRNKAMAEYLDNIRKLGNETIVVAFPGGRGTQMMLDIAKSYEFMVMKIREVKSCE